MVNFALSGMMLQHAHSRDTERVAKHYDDELLNVAEHLNAANRRVAELEAKLKKQALDLAVSEAYNEGLRAQLRAIATAEPKLPILQDSGAKDAKGKPLRIVTKQYFYPAFDRCLKALMPSIKDPTVYRD